MRLTLTVLDPKNRSERRDFIELPYHLYKKDPNWVPPLRKVLSAKLFPRKKRFSQEEPRAFFLVYAKGKCSGRIMVGIHDAKSKGEHAAKGYFALFESIRDVEVARLLFRAAMDWLRVRGIHSVIGPLSPFLGDDYQGLLVEGHRDFPAIRTNHSKPYYAEMFEELGFACLQDFYAYDVRVDHDVMRRNGHLMDSDRKKRNVKIDVLHFDSALRDIHDIYTVMTRSDQRNREWTHMPSYEQFYKEFQSLKRYIHPSFVQIARIHDQPVGFVVGVPDYNQVLVHLRGRRGLIGMLKYHHYRRKIDRIRGCLLCVDAQYKDIPIKSFLLAGLYQCHRDEGYSSLELSTIAQQEEEDLKETEYATFLRKRVYRIYHGEL